MKHVFLLLLTIFATTALWAGNVITYTAKKKQSIDRKAFNVDVTKHAFSEGIGTITFSGNVSSIGDWAFYRCKSLKSVTIPSSVTSIGDWAFHSCSSLFSIAIPNSVKSIEKGAFSYCSSLTSITIPNSVTNIGWWAFKCCTSLKSIYIPNSVTNIGEHAFDNCSSDLIIYVPSESISRFQSMPALANRTIQSSASQTNSTQPEPTQIVNPKQPPLLVLIPNSLQLIDENNNQAIEELEECKIRFKIANIGKGPAEDCQYFFLGNVMSQILCHAKSEPLPVIAPGDTLTVEIPYSAPESIQEDTILFSIQVTEPNGYDIETTFLSVKVHKKIKPLLKVVDYTINRGNTSSIQRLTPFELNVLIQNVQLGEANDVTVQITIPEGVSLFDGKEKQSYATMDGGEQKAIDYQLIVSNNFTRDTLPIQFVIKERYGRYAESRTILLPVNIAENTVVHVRCQESEVAVGQQVALGSLVRDGNSIFANSTAAAANTNYIQAVAILNPFDIVPMSSVLATYNIEFRDYEMPERDESFPFALVSVRLKGDRAKVRLAKQTLQLNLGFQYQTEKIVTAYENQILYLIPIRTRSIYLTCGDGCEQQLIYSGRLESNRIYEGVVEVK